MTTYVDWYAGKRTQNWRTPASFFDPLHAKYKFTMDGASEPGNGLLPRASTAENQLSWYGERVFCNPPWSNIAPFLELATAFEFSAFLVPARTNAKWFHRALRIGMKPEFFLGKIKFDGAKWNSPVDCLLLLYGRAT